MRSILCIGTREICSKGGNIILTKAQVIVDTYPISMGRTNCFFNSTKPNTTVCISMDVPRFWEIMTNNKVVK